MNSILVSQPGLSDTFYYHFGMYYSLTMTAIIIVFILLVGMGIGIIRDFIELREYERQNKKI